VNGIVTEARDINADPYAMFLPDCPEQNANNITYNQVLYNQGAALNNAGDIFPYNMHFDPTLTEDLMHYHPAAINDDFHAFGDQGVTSSFESYFDLDKYF